MRDGFFFLYQSKNKSNVIHSTYIANPYLIHNLMDLLWTCYGLNMDLVWT